MAGFTVPIVYQEIGKETALASLARVNRTTQQMVAGLAAAGEAAGDAANSFQKMGKAADQAIKNQNSFSKLQREFKALALEVARYDAALAQTNSTLRLHLHSVNAPILAYERQQKALISSRAALAAFNIEKFKETLANKLSLDNAKRDALAKDAQARAQEKVRVSLELMNSAEGRQLAVSQMAARLTQQKNLLLAQQDPLIKRLTADLARMTAVQNSSVLAQHKFNLRLALGNQATSSMRAAIYGLGTSFGIYTSSTVIAAAATFAFFSGLRATFKTGIEFEAQLSRLGALISNAGAGTTEYANHLTLLKERALEIASSTRFMASEVMDAMEKLGLAGFTVEQTVAGVRDVLNLAAIGALDFGEAADIASNVLMGFGMQIEELGRVVDVIARAATESNLNVQELGHSMSYAAPVAKSFGVSLEFTAAMMEVLANAGIKGSRAGTGLRRMLISLFTPNERAQKVMKRFGLTVNEVSKEMSDLEGLERPIQNLFKGAAYGTDALIKKIKEFYMATAGATTNLELLRESVGVYALPAFTQLIASLDRGEKSLFAVAAGLDSVAGSADEALRKIQDNLQTTLLLIKSAAEAAALKIYDSEKGGLKDLADEALLAMRTISRSPEVLNAFVSAIKALGEAIWGVIKLIVIFKGAMLIVGVVTSLVTGIQLLAGAFTSLAAALAIFKGAGLATSLGMVVSQFKLLAGAAAGLALSVFTPMGLAITATIGLLTYLITKFVDLKKVFSGFSGTFNAYNQADEAQRLQDAQRYESLVSGQLEKLHAQRDSLEKQLRLQRSQTEEAAKLKTELAGVSQELNAAYEDLRRYAEINLSLDILEAKKGIEELGKAISDLEKDKNKVVRGWGGGAMPESPWSRQAVIALQVDKGVEAQIKKENLALIAQQAHLRSLQALQESILNTSKEQQRFSLTGGLSANKRTLEMLEKLFKQTREKYLEFLKLSQAEDADRTLAYLGEIQATISAVRGETAKLEEQMRRFGRTSAVSLEETVAFMNQMLKEASDVENRLALPEADRLALDLDKAREAASRAKEQFHGLVASLTNLVEQERKVKAGSDAAIALSEARKEVTASLSGAMGSHVEAMQALDEAENAYASASEASNKAAGGRADAFGKVLNAAYELAEAERALQEAQIDHLQTWLDVNDQLIRRTEIYDTLIAKSQAYAATMEPRRITAYEATGVPSPASGTGPAVRPVGGVPARAGNAAQIARDAAASVGLDPDLFLKLISRESNWNANAQSSAGAYGYTQLMPGTAKDLGVDRYNPTENLYGGARYLKQQIDRFGSTELGLAAYNAGPGAVEKYGGIPPFKETQDYVKAITGQTAPLKEQRLAYEEVTKEMVVFNSTASEVEKQQIANIQVAQQETNWLEAEAEARKASDLALMMLPQTLGKVRAAKDAVAASQGKDLALNEALSQAYKEQQAAMGLYLDAMKKRIEYEEQAIRVGQKTRLEVERTAEEWDALAAKYGTAYAAAQDYRLAQAQVNALLEQGRMSAYEASVAMDEFRQRLADAQGPIAGFYESLNYGAKDFKEAFVDAMATLRDSIAEALETGKMSFQDFFDSIKKFIYRFLADKAIQLFLAPFAGALGLTVTGANAIAGAAGQGGQAAGVTGATGNNGMSLSGITNLFGGSSIGTSVAGGLEWINGNMLGNSIGEGFLSSVGAGLQTVPNWAFGAGGLAGGVIGNMMFGDQGYGSIGSSIGAMGGSLIGGAVATSGAMSGMAAGATMGSVVPVVGTIIGGILGGIAGGALGASFGSDTPDAPGVGMQVSGGTLGLQGGQGDDMDQIVTDINNALTEVNKFLDSLASTLGAEAIAIRQSYEASNALTKPENVGEWINNMIVDMASAMAGAVPGLFGEAIRDAWNQAGGDVEKFAAMAAQLRQLYDALPQIITILTSAGVNLGENAERTAAALVIAAGDLDTLLSLQANYNDLFTSEAEKQTQMIAQLEAAFASIGLVLPDTREELVALVEGLDLSTESGRAAYLSILSVATALDTMYDSAEATAAAALEAAAALTEAMAEIQASAVATLRTVIYNDKEQAQIAAHEAARRANAIAEAGTGIDVTDYSQEAFGKMVKSLRSPDGVLVAEAELSAALGDQADNYAKAVDEYYKAQAALNSMNKSTRQVAPSARVATSALNDLSDALLDWVRKTREAAVRLLQPNSLGIAKSQFYSQLSSAQSGNRGALATLTQYADTYLDLAKQRSRTSSDYYRLVAEVTNPVESLALKKPNPGMTSGFLPTFAGGGIATGPSTGYPAILHGEEAVIPLENGNVPINISYSDLITEIKALRYDMNAGAVRQIELNKKTADTLTKWDADGQPPERT